MLIKLENFSLMKKHFKMLSAKWRPFCSGGDVLIRQDVVFSQLVWIPGPSNLYH